MVLTCTGSHLRVELNGEYISDTMLDKTLMKDRPLEGYIGFQDHGEPNNIRFRSIRVHELTEQRALESGSFQRLTPLMS